MAVMSGTPAPWKGHPPISIRVVTRCLEKKPEARYASGAELRAALAECRVRHAARNPGLRIRPLPLDVALSRLERAGDPITIPPKTFDLLVLLARNQHRVVSKAELMETLWPNTFVEEGNLTQHIYTLRKALGDRPDGHPISKPFPAAATGWPRRFAMCRTPAAQPRHGRRTPATRRRRRRAPRSCSRASASGPRCCTRGLANASDIAERLGSVEMHQLIDRMLLLAQEEVARYDGVITAEARRRVRCRVRRARGPRRRCPPGDSGGAWH